MGRSTGHLPLTHYERTKKFASSSYGTTTTRLSGDSQTPFGHCSLGLTPIEERSGDTTSGKNSNESTTTTVATVTPSGHVYAPDAILEYLLTKTQEYQQQLAAYQAQQAATAGELGDEKRKRQEQQESFAASQSRSMKRAKTTTEQDTNKESNKATAASLKKTSYWLPDSQPDSVDVTLKEPQRPASPFSGEPLRRKDLRPIALLRRDNGQDVVCAISGKAIRMQPALAYWTSKGNKDKSLGVVVLKDVYDRTIAADNSNKKDTKGTPLMCPLTGAKIRHSVELHSSGSGFAAHNAVEVKTYKPTIT